MYEYIFVSSVENYRCTVLPYFTLYRYSYTVYIHIYIYIVLPPPPTHPPTRACLPKKNRSIWGSFTASRVSATPMRMTTPPQSKDRQGGGSTGNGELPFDTSASGANDAAAPKGKGCGATWYRADSFPFQKSNMRLTKEWVSLPAACLYPGLRGLVCLPALMRFVPPRVLGAIISYLPYCTGGSREGILVLILLSYSFSNKL